MPYQDAAGKDLEEKKKTHTHTLQGNNGAAQGGKGVGKAGRPSLADSCQPGLRAEQRADWAPRGAAVEEQRVL